MEEKPDSELVVSARGGDTEAFAALVDRHWTRTRALAQAIVRDPDEAEDLAQEAVFQAYLGLEHLRDPARFGAWLYGIAANLARMRMRAGRRTAAWDGARVASVDELAEAAEAAALVREALAVLPAAQREAVLMHDVAGFSAGEIAARVGGSSGAVRVRLHRGRRELRKRLASLAPEMTRKETSMVEVELRDVVVRVRDEPGEDGRPRLAEENRIVLLQERGGKRVLPIWVGAGEGDSLALHLGSEPVPRPLTADLMARLLEATGARVDHVVVSSLRENTFYGMVNIVSSGGDASEIDARPSDAVNLAVRVGAPMLVDEAVFEQAALAGAGPDELDREMAKVAERLGAEAEPPAAGEWRSLSPELVRAVGSYRSWSGSTEQEAASNE